MKGIIRPIISIGLSLMLGCGGGGGTGAGTGAEVTAGTPPATTTTITGLASKGPISNGTVKVYAIRNGAADTSAPLGLVLTDDSGKYTVDIGTYKGAIMVEVSGGSFKDEVSGTTVTLKNPMRALVAGTVTGTNTVAVTPMTHFASKTAGRGGALTAVAIADANAGMSALFGLADIVQTLPVAGGAVDQKKYADACGVISQLVNDGKLAGETLDNALPRVMGKLESEVEQDGGFSSDTLNKLNSAVTEFNKSGGSAAAASPAGGRFKIATTGGTNVIGAIDMTVTLPDGAEMAVDPATDEALAGTVTISGVAATGANRLVTARVTPASALAPARLTISMSNSAGFGSGECVTIEFKMAPGAPFPASAAAFTLSGVAARGPDGLPVSGVTASATSLSGL